MLAFWKPYKRKTKRDQAMHWLLLMDLDGTLWDHKDISQVEPPYFLLKEGILSNEKGTTVRLYREAVDFVKWCKTKGAVTSTLSWNVERNARLALNTFGVDSLFDEHAIDYPTDKAELLLKVLQRLKNKGIVIHPRNIVYVDDRKIHIERIKNKVGEVIFVNIWGDVANYEEAKKLVQKAIFGG
ncbi:magnesium-dependent phosphatase-1 [Candidatus Marsarchaeota G1 archaeon OSP_B]|uniref:Magnesium-dependent phosphatase-1 n=4 Tax=Candidatus Marsarchaeota group 1 TaxID=2203770 RepID=A0A2R6AAR4_9ARCH|nr:MAG: magnesium-dependent phosphatase-1 [Candidatus Marsarchaeota G1 archaeon OSP_D]PSN88228.1 MAG: magnesium-dependent phosphatase-1 [Candidatus Marsarchaeota G1 archaeon OSP_C]PSN94055.1 MAG: magnesium-dependent phosphatase-1 [Candidatus Marsarchaeota G1 archaeon OSP_B]